MYLSNYSGFFTAKYKILQLYPNVHSSFYSEIRNLELYPDGHLFFLQRNTKFWKLHPNGHSFFLQRSREFWKLYPNGICISHKQMRNLTFIINLVLLLKIAKKIWFRDTLETKLETLLNFGIHIIHKKGYKNIDYRKLVTSLYNSFLKPAVYCRKNRCKKVSPY